MQQSQLAMKKDSDLDTKAVAVEFDLKSLADDGTFEGYASKFNNIDRGRDRVLPGAFAKSLRKRPADGVKLLLNHDHTKIVGGWDELREDSKGLWGKGRIFDELELGKETLFLMRQKQLNSLSIGYRTIDADYNQGEDIRDLKELDLWEVSVVTFPMNEEAVISAVKGADLAPKDIERILRDADLPVKFAKLIVNHGVMEAKRIIANDCRDGDDGEAKQTLEAIQRLDKLMKA